MSYGDGYKAVLLAGMMCVVGLVQNTQAQDYEAQYLSREVIRDGA
jgi:hypothetical protein